MNFSKVFLIIILGSIAFYSIFLFLSDISSLDSYSITFKYEYVFIILIFVVGSWIPLFLRWRLLCKNLGLKISFRTDLLVYLAGFALSITPAKIGELLRTQILRDKSGIQRTQTTPLIFIEKFYDLLGAVIVSSIGILYFPQIGIIVLGGLILSIFIFILFSSKITFDKSIVILSKFNFTKNFIEPLSKSHEILKNSTKTKIFLSSIILSILYWLTVSFAVLLVLKSLSIDSLGFTEIASTYASSLFLGALSFLPGGLGITEASFTGLLNIQGISLSMAIIIVIIVRLFTLWFGVGIGFIALKLVGGFSVKSTNS
jgi:glycosyltransferase 2 family protein